MFAGCTSLTSVTLPNSLSRIADHEFAGCTSLTNITIPSSVTLIADWAFAGSALTNVTLPNNVSSIGVGAFENCTNLTTLILPNSVTNIGTFAFYGCTNLSSAWFQGNAPPFFGSSVFDYAASGFTIYYPVAATGWSTPIWKGYHAVPYGYTQPVLTLIRGVGIVTPSFTNLQFGTNYQLLVSADLKSWGNAGAPFTATNTSEVHPQPFTVTNWNRLFFRLRLAP